MWSCQDFLEEPSDVSGQTEAVVFSTIETAEQVLAAPYSSLPWGWPALNGNGAWSQGILIYFAPISTASDEADTALEGGYNFVHPQYHEGLPVRSIPIVKTNGITIGLPFVTHGTSTTRWIW